MASQSRGRSWVIELPYERPPLSLNDRLNWRVEHKIKSELRATVAALVRQAEVPALDRISVGLEWIAPTRGRRDADNPFRTLKTCVDAVVDAGVVPDDTPQYVGHDRTIITYEKGVKRLRLIITEEEE